MCETLTPVARVSKMVRLPRRTVVIDNPCPVVLFDPCKLQAFFIDSCGVRHDLTCVDVDATSTLAACCSDECCVEDFAQVMGIVDEDGNVTFWAKTSDGHIYKLETGAWVEKECEPIVRPECLRGVTAELGAALASPNEECNEVVIEVEKRILHADAVMDKTSDFGDALCPP